MTERTLEPMVNDEGDTIYSTEPDDVLHHRGRMDDRYLPFIRFAERITQRPVRITADWDWKDQGWGNLKGMLKLVLKRDGTILAEVEMSATVAEHDWRHAEFMLEEGELLDSMEAGDELCIERHVGGGGGHELFVKDFRLALIGTGFVFK